LKLKYLAILVLYLISFSAFGCSCAPYSKDPSEAVLEAYSSSTAVVLATAESIEKVKTTNPWGKGEVDSYEYDVEITHFISLRSWKGSHGKNFYTRIITNCCMCGLKFTEEETYLLYLDGPHDNGYYSTSTCSRTVNLERAETDIKILDALTPDQLVKWKARPKIVNEDLF